MACIVIKTVMVNLRTPTIRLSYKPSGCSATLVYSTYQPPSSENLVGKMLSWHKRLGNFGAMLPSIQLCCKELKCFGFVLWNMLTAVF